MQMKLGYLGRSEILQDAAGFSLRFSPNLSRPKVFFDAEVKQPIRFREAISALHDVVVGDLRVKKKDRTAYEEWKKEEARRQVELREQIFKDAKQAEMARLAKQPIRPGLEDEFHKMHRLYWDARRKWASELSRNDPELFRHLVPCDPVVTVAPDVVFFECFSKDESSYACLSVDRDAFKDGDKGGLGTTNVDYSLALYDHFQTLRTYRPTRLLVDPKGFEVKVESLPEYREEKIDLPPSWLRGFGQIQAAMSLPTRKVELSKEAVYSVLAYLKRHREKTGPRSIRFQLTPGRPAVIALDPWDVKIDSRAKPYEGERAEEIKIWGRRRLFSLARVLPLAERFTVHLLGSGLPSIWIAHLGEMRFVLALSGWTTNDWTSGANLELLAKDTKQDASVTAKVAQILEEKQSAPLGLLTMQAGRGQDVVLGSLFTLAKQGQVIFDHAAQTYRWRQVMPVALSESLLGPEPIEVVEGKKIAHKGEVEVLREEPLPNAKRLVVAKADNTSCEAIFDADGAFTKAKCTCKHFRKFGIRSGPCRHLLALRLDSGGLSLGGARA
jgi:hypothetical protein